MFLCKAETAAIGVSFGYLNRLADGLGISPWRFFLPEVQFAALNMLEDDFVLEVRPFLKSLSAEQKAEVLKLCAAAPQVKPWTGRGRHSAHTEKATSNASKSFIGNQDSVTKCLTSATPCSSSAALLSKTAKLPQQRFAGLPPRLFCLWTRMHGRHKTDGPCSSACTKQSAVKPKT